MIDIFNLIEKLNKDKKILSCYTPTYGGIAEAVFKMCLGNQIGFKFEDIISLDEVFKYNYGGFIVETDFEIEQGILLGKTHKKYQICYKECVKNINMLQNLYENKLEPIYSCNSSEISSIIPKINFKTEQKLKGPKIVKPKVLIPVFSGTNCEYETKKAFDKAGAETEIFIVKNLNSEMLQNSINEFAKKIETSQIIFIPGGFSGGDEPEGSAKFITSFFRNDKIKNKLIVC